MFNLIINTITIILFILLILKYLIIGFFYNCNIGKKLIKYEVNNIKKKYEVIDEKNYLATMQKNSNILLIILVICSFIIIYFKSEYSCFIALLAIVINFKVEKRKDSYLKFLTEIRNGK